MSAWILTKAGVIEACVKGRTFSVQPDHPMYTECLSFIRSEDYDRFAAIANVEDAIQLLLNFDDPNIKIAVKNGNVFYKFNETDIPVNNYLTQNLLSFMRSKLPIRPVILFLENLMQNPSTRAVKELFGFLQHKGLPLTQDGCFLGYKRVQADWTDIRSGMIVNTPGTRVPEMLRNMCDDNWGVDCSEGYHVGSLEYVRTFHNDDAGTHVVIVKVNPKDVVSVPREESTKMRCTVYEVVDEYDQELKNHLPYSLYDAKSLQPVEVGGELVTLIQKAVPTTFHECDEPKGIFSQYGDDDFEDEDDIFDEDEEDQDDEDDEIEDSFDDEDQDEEFVISQAVINWVVKWLEDKNISTEYLNHSEVQAAIKENDGIGILQALYGAVVEADDKQAKQVLTDRYYRGELMNLLQG